MVRYSGLPTGSHKQGGAVEAEAQNVWDIGVTALYLLTVGLYQSRPKNDSNKVSYYVKNKEGFVYIPYP